MCAPTPLHNAMMCNAASMVLHVSSNCIDDGNDEQDEPCRSSGHHREVFICPSE